jgi:hypothetical protein
LQRQERRDGAARLPMDRRAATRRWGWPHGDRAGRSTPSRRSRGCRDMDVARDAHHSHAGAVAVAIHCRAESYAATAGWPSSRRRPLPGDRLGEQATRGACADRREIVVQRSEIQTALRRRSMAVDRSPTPRATRGLVPIRPIAIARYASDEFRNTFEHRQIWIAPLHVADLHWAGGETRSPPSNSRSARSGVHRAEMIEALHEQSRAGQQNDAGATCAPTQ